MKDSWPNLSFSARALVKNQLSAPYKADMDVFSLFSSIAFYKICIFFSLTTSCTAEATDNEKLKEPL